MVKIAPRKESLFKIAPRKESLFCEWQMVRVCLVKPGNQENQ